MKVLLLIPFGFLLFLLLPCLLWLGLAKLYWMKMAGVSTLVFFLISEEMLSAVTVKSGVSCGFGTYGFGTYVDEYSLYAHFWWILLIINGYWILSKSSFHIYWEDCMVFILQFVNVVHHTDWLLNIKKSLYLWINPTWLCSVIFECIIGIDLLEDFCVYVPLWYWLGIFFFCFIFGF